MNPFSDKIILVTGASSGIGKETARYRAGEGVKGVALFARSADKLEAVAKEINEVAGPTKALVIVGDVSKEADNQRAVEETVKTFGGITGAFINAGAYVGGMPLHETPDDKIDSVVDVNIKGVIFAFRHLIPAIKATVGDLDELRRNIDTDDLGAACRQFSAHHTRAAARIPDTPSSPSR
mgnify:CR=1 FL=1